MRIIVTGSVRIAEYYCVSRGWPRQSVKIVTDPMHLRGLGRGVEIIMLEPRQAYRYSTYREFLDFLGWMERNGRATVTHDDCDNWL